MITIDIDTRVDELFYEYHPSRMIKEIEISESLAKKIALKYLQSNPKVLGEIT